MAPRLARSQKVLAGMAAGAWLLHTSWIEASATAHRPVEPVRCCMLSLAGFC